MSFGSTPQPQTTTSGGPFGSATIQPSIQRLQVEAFQIHDSAGPLVFWLYSLASGYDRGGLFGPKTQPASSSSI